MKENHKTEEWNLLLQKNKNMKYIFFFLILFSFINLNAQNLVMNPSFEDTYYYKSGNKTLKFCSNWDFVKVFVDYYYKDGQENHSCYLNLSGVQEPRTGDGFLVMHLVDRDAKETGGLAVGELVEPLKAGKCYYAEAYLSCADKSVNYTSNFEFIFSDTTFNSTQRNKYFQMLTPAVSNSLDNFIKDKINWVKVSGVFKAEGGEQFILIGNTQKYATTINNDKSDYTCIYYIDDVSVVELPFCPEDEFSVDSLMVFDNLNFETGKSVILENSYDELDKFVSYLTLFEEFNVEISGHTDNVGTSEFNQQLSENRAKAVCDYLTSKGIASERLLSTGFGDTKPIADNSTDEGKAQNRRVEFIILKK